MIDIPSQKAAARIASFAARKGAHGHGLSQIACQHLRTYLLSFRGQSISGYMPIRTEINPLPVMAEMAQFGPVGVPVIQAAGKPLEFHRWNPNAEMKPGPFGAKIPAKPDPVIPSVIILPLVAYDARGFRLGYGGGFYDRTLEMLGARGLVHAVGFAYAAQLADALPVEPTDQRLDAVVTENGVTHFRPLAKPPVAP